MKTNLSVFGVISAVLCFSFAGCSSESCDPTSLESQGLQTEVTVIADSLHLGDEVFLKVTFKNESEDNLIYYFDNTKTWDFLIYGPSGLVGKYGAEIIDVQGEWRLPAGYEYSKFARFSFDSTIESEDVEWIDPSSILEPGEYFIIGGIVGHTNDFPWGMVELVLLDQ